MIIKKRAKMNNPENLEDAVTEDGENLIPISEESATNIELNSEEESPTSSKNQESDAEIGSPSYFNLERVFEIFPAFKILKSGRADEDDDEEYINVQSQIIDGVFEEFNINAKVSSWFRGSRVVQFEIQTGKGVRVDSIEKYRDNFKLRLGVDRIQIQAPIPGQSAVGIQVPRKTPDIVSLRDVLEKFEVKKLLAEGGSRVS